MNYQPPSSVFSWDRVFRPSFMARLLTSLGLRKESVIKALNYPSFVFTILFFLTFFPVAWTIRLFFGQQKMRVVFPLYGWVWLAFFGVYRRAWYHSALRKDESYVYMAEHFTLMDIPLYGSTWPTDTRALSAKEYANIPMYGWMLRTIGTSFIERRDKNKAIDDLKALSVRMGEENISVLVVPTGTRSPEYGQRPPFKRGVFHMAVEIKRPIVPLYLVGLEELCVGKNFCRPGRVDVVYGEPISPEQYPEEFADVDKLLVLVRDRMTKEGRELRRNRNQMMAA